ncbi:MAG TPA: helix-turn-helix transcriptional regulator [Candidatus Limnocylindrales bacterium]|nr:helix-turn-helix transcriptional regulator [Candidatus Limnocylindrales bacterium]
MGTRQRPSDVGAADARRFVQLAAREIGVTRRTLGISARTASGRAGISASQWGRLERGELNHPSLDLVCRAARGVGLAPALTLHPTGEPIRDAAQLALLARLEELLDPSMRLLREVPLPIVGDLRAWDGRIHAGSRTASIEAESRIHDAQALARRIALKVRDDPDAGVVILVVNATTHNRRVLAEHREALRSQFPLDGAPIVRALRAGRIPAASGLVLL